MIVGGGVAGIAAAVSLADRGLAVILFERRPLLGGRASSHIDAATGTREDECQHGTMLCCTHLSALLERLGSHHHIRWHDRLEFVDVAGRRSAIRGSLLPAPFHTAPSFLRFRSLAARDKLAIGRGMARILRERDADWLERTSMADWMAQSRQTPAAIRRFWRPILVSACNEELESISCATGFFLFRQAFLANPHAYRFGIPDVPLADLYHEPAAAALEGRGGSARCSTIVRSICVDGGRAAGVVLASGTTVAGRAVICAVPPDSAARLMPDGGPATAAWTTRTEAITMAPIMGVHLHFDRPVACPDAVAVLDREIEWIFNKTANFGLEAAGGAYLSLVVSASRRYSGEEPAAIAERLLAEVREVLPDARSANLIRSRVIRWPRATFSPAPGASANRPGPRSPVTDLYIAGEWTATGWPSTMESAARSGYAAAEALLADLGRPERIAPISLAPSLLYRLLRGSAD